MKIWLWLMLDMLLIYIIMIITGKYFCGVNKLYCLESILIYLFLILGLNMKKKIGLNKIFYWIKLLYLIIWEKNLLNILIVIKNYFIHKNIWKNLKNYNKMIGHLLILNKIFIMWKTLLVIEKLLNKTIQEFFK